MNFAHKLQTALDNHKPHAGGDGVPPLRTTHPVDTMFRRHLITEDQYIAALRFRADWECCQYDSHGKIVDWDQFVATALTDEAKRQGGKHKSAMRIARPPNGLPPIVDVRATLAKLEKHVGRLGFQMMRGVAGMGIPVVAISDLLGIHRDIASFRFREALEETTVFYERDTHE